MESTQNNLKEIQTQQEKAYEEFIKVKRTGG